MNILSLSRHEVEEFIRSGFLNSESLRHYDICKALSEKVPQEKVAEIFGVSDDSYVRKIKKRKCPDCYKIGIR